MEYITTQGIQLPKLGLGTFRMPEDVCQPAVESALAQGYRHIDTAQMYDNESAVGTAIANAGGVRSELHVTTKVWHTQLASDAILRSFDTSLAKLKLDYVDLFLVHWPTNGMDLPAMFETLMRLREEGRTRAIGVANFTLPMLRTVVEDIGAPLACNQIEYHPFLDQTPVYSYLRRHAIPLVAYCPLAQGKVTEDPVLQHIADKHNASPAQVALRWLLDQDGVAAIPKSQRAESQQANLDALKLVLDDEDRRVIGALRKDQRLVNPPFAPHWDPAAR